MIEEGPPVDSGGVDRRPGVLGAGRRLRTARARRSGSPNQASALRAVVASSIGIASGVFAFTVAAGLIDSSWLTDGAVALAVGIVVGVLIHRRPVVVIDDGACSRVLKIVSGVATLAALVQLARLAVFMVNPAQVGYSVVPGSKWEIQHSCVSAYFVSAQAASSSPDVYDDSLFTMPNDDPAKVRNARALGPFKVDVYEYPPPFLLLPRALRLLAPDFVHFRRLWFGFSGAVVLLGSLFVARRLGSGAGTRALLLSPLVWASMPMLGTLQKGNVQVVVIAAAMLAMVLFERQRWAAGGALLAFATMSKLYPGILLVYLLARREWRAVGWTAALGIVFLAVSLVDTGWPPYKAFVHHLPGIFGGEAFPAFRNPAAIAINLSVPGIAFKLKLFGVPGMGFGALKILGWLYTLAAVAVTVLVARRPASEDVSPLVWLAILVLATLRSPFLPQTYATLPPLWLLTLAAALVVPTTRTLIVVVFGWAVLNVYWPIDWPLGSRWLALGTALPQAAIVVIAVFVLRPWALRRTNEGIWNGPPTTRESAS